MELKRIVVGIDFSEESDVAAAAAMNIARHTGAQLVLVHVGTVIESRAAGIPEGAALEWEGIVKEQLHADRRRLEELRQRIAGQGVEVSHMVIDGFPDTGLRDVASDLDAELIVTGSHGRTGVRRFLMGSVAERTVRLSDRSVMVARPGANTAGGYKRILVPTDFSPHAEAAIELALVLAAPDARIELANFWQLPVVAGGYYAPIRAAEAAVASIREDIRKDVISKGADLVAKYARDGVKLTFAELEAGAGHGIIDHLKETDRNYDLVVMGSHGRRGFRRWILGSVSEVTVRHAPCSIIAVHTDVRSDP